MRREADAAEGDCVIRFPRLQAGTFIEAAHNSAQSTDKALAFPRLQVGTFIEA